MSRWGASAARYAPVLTDAEAAVICVGSQNFDLVVSQDLVTAYLGPEKMDHLFRVFESVVSRVKRPDAIVVLK